MFNLNAHIVSFALLLHAENRQRTYRIIAEVELLEAKLTDAGIINVEAELQFARIRSKLDELRRVHNQVLYAAERATADGAGFGDYGGLARLSTYMQPLEMRDSTNFGEPSRVFYSQFLVLSGNFFQAHVVEYCNLLSRVASSTVYTEEQAAIGRDFPALYVRAMLLFAYRILTPGSQNTMLAISYETGSFSQAVAFLERPRSNYVTITRGRSFTSTSYVGRASLLYQMDEVVKMIGDFCEAQTRFGLWNVRHGVVPPFSLPYCDGPTPELEELVRHTLKRFLDHAELFAGQPVAPFALDTSRSFPWAGPNLTRPALVSPPSNASRMESVIAPGF